MQRLFASLILLLAAFPAWAQIVVPINKSASAQLSLPEACPNPEMEDRALCIVNETWLSIEGYEGKYEVSSKGRVKSLRRVVERTDGKPQTISERILKPCVIQERNGLSGYAYVNLSANGRPHLKRVHRLVAVAFLGPCPFGCVVNHKNGNKLNNDLSNIEWVTSSENTKHAEAMGLASHPKGRFNGNAKLTDEDVVSIRDRYANGEKQIDLASEFGITQGAVHKIISRRCWKHVTEGAA